MQHIADIHQSSEFQQRPVMLLGLLIVLVFLSGIVSAAKPANVAEARSNCPETVGDEIIDLEGLINRLKKSRAVGMMTKIKLNGQINTLLDKFKVYHAGKSPYSIEQLREQFDLLYLKVVSLIQDKDTDLHKQLCFSWDLIWDQLHDPELFKKVSAYQRGSDYAYL